MVNINVITNITDLFPIVICNLTTFVRIRLY